MIAIGGAIGTGLFLGSGFAIGLAGPAVLVSYAIGALIALLLMGCLAEMTIAHPTSGSFGAYAEYYVGPLAGFLVRYAYWTCIVLAVGTEVTAVALYMHFWFPRAPAWMWIVGFSALLIARQRPQRQLCSAPSSTGSRPSRSRRSSSSSCWPRYLLWRAPARRSAQRHRACATTPPMVASSRTAWWGAWVAVIVAIFSYLSIEMIAVAAGEAAQTRSWRCAAPFAPRCCG